jgi:hypothetical protein
MFLHRRNKISYLWYCRKDGRRLKVLTYAITKANTCKSMQSFKQSLSPDGKLKNVISEIVPEVQSCVAATQAKSTAYPF